MGLPDATSAVELALETSSAHGSVALGRGGRMLEERAFESPRMHAADLLPTVDALCRAHDVTPEMIGRVYVSIGPGSFTGIRISLTVARTMALATGAKLIGLPSTLVIAQNALEMAEGGGGGELAVLLDAGRGRVYAHAFRRGANEFVPSDQPVDVDPVAFFDANPEVQMVLGEGAKLCANVLATRGIVRLPPEGDAARAGVLWTLGHRLAARGSFDDPRSIVPLYVRLPDAEEKWRARNPSSG